MIDYRCKLNPGNYYHVYNRGIDGCSLFHDKGNYRFFLRRYADYMHAIVDTYAWCLMPNHFHFLIRVKEEENVSLETVSHFENAKQFTNNDPSAAFQRLFTSYSKAFNIQQCRHGSLFEKPFRRKEVNSNLYLKQLVLYIHNNPIHHGFVNSPEKWEFSSFHQFINDELNVSHSQNGKHFVNDENSFIRKNEVLKWFEDEENFKAVHKQKIILDNKISLE